MVATVTGVVPFVSMMRDYLNRRDSGHFFHILEGASYADEFTYDTELNALAMKHPEVLNYLTTVSRPEAERNKHWKGAHGRVNLIVEDYVDSNSIRVEETLVYLCGHPGMIEDLKERYYVSYELAAHRFTNLATARLDIPVHFVRTDPQGRITKAYENDGISFPCDADGSLEGARLNRNWGARQAWAGSDVLHHQFTETDHGDYWCVTYVENTSEGTPYAVTLGCRATDALWFRGCETMRRVDGRSDTEQANPEMVGRWDGVAWPSAAERSFVLTALPPAYRDFTPFPGVDLLEVYRFLDRQNGLG